MDTLAKLFGGAAYVKIMRLFLFNKETPFETREVRVRTQIPYDSAKRELSYLAGVGMIKRKRYAKEIHYKEQGKEKIRKKKAVGWILNKEFLYLDGLQQLLLTHASFYRNNIVERFRNVGKVKLLVISGVFTSVERSCDRVDILIVGDRLERKPIRVAVKSLESEVGRELRYSVFKTNDFLYRLDVYDRFVRDVLDYPHEKLINRIGVS